MVEAPDAPPHRFGLRVYWEDTDGGGIVYHASYLRFAERGRTEMLRAAGIGQHSLLEESGVAFAVRRMLIDFRAPARLDDWLEVTTSIAELSRASLELTQAIVRDGRVLVDLTVQLACIDRRGRAVRLPPPIRAAFETLTPSSLDRAAPARQEHLAFAADPDRD